MCTSGIISIIEIKWGMTPHSLTPHPLSLSPIPEVIFDFLREIGVFYKV